MLVLGAIYYLFGIWVVDGLFLAPLLFAVILFIALPDSPRRRRIIGLIFKPFDVIGRLLERVEDSFERFENRIRR